MLQYAYAGLSHFRFSTLCYIANDAALQWHSHSSIFQPPSHFLCDNADINNTPFGALSDQFRPKDHYCQPTTHPPKEADSHCVINCQGRDNTLFGASIRGIICIIWGTWNCSTCKILCQKVSLVSRTQMDLVYCSSKGDCCESPGDGTATARKSARDQREISNCDNITYHAPIAENIPSHKNLANIMSKGFSCQPHPDGLSLLLVQGGLLWITGR